ncbi:putative nucleic-acid-binding protein containing a Zn-ribbon [Archaeoglobus sulfaticallidus PM70-1]|uniref:Putative nucleic-acid-binding protein containing a Zn-ribbon n=1 Tax=Archaeoglobus sulfaticallidus PM70-1 TaxID=387631 RepID=N0BH27_9EURY|nr:Zn-ribbon domain-containing OB-fold protein [Archaeoglobus sulfaticallidus]AGK61582.1 putative nucleic-acid-binding protein containing a Zn-ribbon [Archaeoglobus sulfaticallidus PM70-1]
MIVITFKEYFDALLEGKLLGLKCKDCGAYTCPPKAVCDSCGSRNLEKVQLSGKGVIRTFTTTYIAPAGYDKEVPYTVAMVELEEGPWIVGRLDFDKADEVGQGLIGEEVEVFGKEMPTEMFYPDKKRRVVPYFRLLR